MNLIKSRQHNSLLPEEVISSKTLEELAEMYYQRDLMDEKGYNRIRSDSILKSMGKEVLNLMKYPITIGSYLVNSTFFCPTLIRKMDERGYFDGGVYYEEGDLSERGMYTGFAIWQNAFSYTLVTAVTGDLTLLKIGLATNIASGLYEWVKSKRKE